MPEIDQELPIISPNANDAKRRAVTVVASYAPN